MMIGILKKNTKSVFLRITVCALLIANCSGCSSITKPNQPLRMVWLSSLNLEKMTSGWGAPQKNKSIQSKPLRIAGRQFENGVGTHANSIMYVDMKGSCQKFSAYVGVDDEVEGKTGSVCFKIYADGKRLYDSGVVKAGEKAKYVNIDLTGCKQMKLLVDSAGDNISYDHADWVQAAFFVVGENPEAIDTPIINEKKVILTPKPGTKPKINGPKVYSCRPGRPFIYRIPCTGKRPISFRAENLPQTLKLDSGSGIITGTAPKQRGEYNVILKARNKQGSMRQPFTIVVGDNLTLTPPMGWNSWYIHYARVTDGHMRRAADSMTGSGMADFGYQYVNIDDCWMVEPNDADPKRAGEPRDSDGAINSNAYFPDMKALADYIHSKGLKAGLYTSPGPTTCQRYTGTYQHERIDAEKFAEWEFDFLKYDWCSYGRLADGEGLEQMQKPYRKMGEILAGLDRDIVYNLCQYGMGDVWEWGGSVDGNCWRTTGDLGLEAGSELPGFYHIGLSNAKHWEYARPGQWNDPDYILIGWVGNAHKQAEGKPTTLTPNEQYSYMSMWCLMAAPLIFSGDMEKLDEFTLNILCNAEVIEINQDQLGKQAPIIEQTEDYFIMAKDMIDGSKAVGLFNTAEIPTEITVKWNDININGPHRVRDLWRQKNLGTYNNQFKAKVPRHGVVFIRLFPTNGS
ncbi:MAG: NPCBM/NEW2 domain-containing protein [Sedimentisphaerales bacterium]|nr:NPCBM/NEW2 domain-containing protein [Sedimentisphaerales bacterium]